LSLVRHAYRIMKQDSWVVYTNFGMILYGNKNLSGKAVLLSNSAELFMSLFSSDICCSHSCTYVLYIYIYMKLCTNDLLSCPDDIFTVKLADRIWFAILVRDITVQNAICTNQYDLHQTIKNAKYANRSYITLYKKSIIQFSNVFSLLCNKYCICRINIVLFSYTPVLQQAAIWNSQGHPRHCSPSQ